ncbi:hypothetical protein HY933_04205 [Candidatus Falkowbacteria bacterium]|nr:hypothetical protein [Candidatus Falkowbacteria bacterium]
MITLNLLDQKRKNSYHWRRLLLTIQSGIELWFFTILCLGIIFSAAEYFLQTNFEDTTAQNALINQTIGGDQQEILAINYQLKEIDGMQREYIAWDPFLMALVNVIPPDLKLRNLTIDATAMTVDITGIAKDRATLLKLKSGLANLYVTDKVNSPIDNLLRKDNIDFAFHLLLNPQRLRYD